MDSLSRLEARASIEDSLRRYARAVDRRDWAALRSCYHPDATDEHGEFSGALEDFIDWVSKRHATVPFSAHFLGNCLIEFIDDKSAIVETYFVAIQRRANGASGDVDTDVIGRYLDRFERRDGLWKVATRRVVYDGSRVVPSSFRPRTGKGTLGRRDLDDPLFALLRDTRR
jgi:hypothetical protein